MNELEIHTFIEFLVSISWIYKIKIEDFTGTDFAKQDLAFGCDSLIFKFHLPTKMERSKIVINNDILKLQNMYSSTFGKVRLDFV